VRHDQNAHPRLIGLAAAFGAMLLLTPVTHAASPSDNLSGDRSSATQTALAIAGVAAMTGKPAAAPTRTAAPIQPTGSKRALTAEERQQFMMLLILHETSRNPIGALR
jgi:hypothetical protein